MEKSHRILSLIDRMQKAGWPERRIAIAVDRGQAPSPPFLLPSTYALHLRRGDR